MDRVILHSDMNSCYANIELLHHPELRGIPVAVGGNAELRHGIILAKDEIAKKAGVKTGMALWQARSICPGIVILPPRMELYIRFSRMMSELYREYTDLVEPFGLDESWLDVTGSAVMGSGEQIAEEIRARVKYEMGVTVSIGVSWNKIFAKLGSDYKKPDAITVINRENYREIAWKLPAEDLLYVGRSTKRKLHSLGIHTIGELALIPPDSLGALLGKMGYVLHSFANGNDSSSVARWDALSIIKSIGNASTTPRDLVCDEDVYIVFLALAESVGARLRENGFKCSVVEIYVRDCDLGSFTRQHKIRYPTDITHEILSHAFELFKSNYSWEKPIRSLGIRGCGLCHADTPYQLDMFTNYTLREKSEKLDYTVDNIRKRYGYQSIQRATALCDTKLSALDAKKNHTVHPVCFFR